jgi:hypothetical protein
MFWNAGRSANLRDAGIILLNSARIKNWQTPRRMLRLPARIINGGLFRQRDSRLHAANNGSTNVFGDFEKSVFPNTIRGSWKT